MSASQICPKICLSAKTLRDAGVNQPIKTTLLAAQTCLQTGYIWSCLHVDTPYKDAKVHRSSLATYCPDLLYSMNVGFESNLQND